MNDRQADDHLARVLDEHDRAAVVAECYRRLECANYGTAVWFRTGFDSDPVFQTWSASGEDNAQNAERAADALLAAWGKQG